MGSRRALAWIVLGVAVLALVAWAAWPDDSGDRVSARVHDLATQLRCPDCEALSVAESSTPTARAIRRDLQHRVKDGQSDEQIRQAYVDAYDETILLKPQGSGLGFLVWGLPVMAVLVGAGGLALAFRRWRREPRLHATDADEQLVARTRDTETT